MRLRRKRSDSQEGSTRRVVRLGEQIAESRQLRKLVRDPDLNAVRMEQTRRRTVFGLWVFLALGLVFTTTGVHAFLAGDTTPADPMWWGAWTVEPMFAGLLIVLLNFEATILAHGVDPDSEWWIRLKRVLLGSTLFMNVTPQLAPLATGAKNFNLGSLAVHLVVPVIVFGLAEVIPVIQARARTVIHLGYADADQADAQPSAEQPAVEQPRTEQPPLAADVRRSSLKLPDAMVDALRQARQRVISEGRQFTVADVQRAIKVDQDMAERIVADFAVHNGHTVL